MSSEAPRSQIDLKMHHVQSFGEVHAPISDGVLANAISLAATVRIST